MVKVGCCGFPVSQEEYFKKFSIVEIQQTFYQIPEEKTALKWRERAFSNFEFTLKAWQLITHPANSPTYRRLKLKIKEEKNYGFFKPTEEVFSAWEETEKVASILKARVIVFQSPSSFRPEKENIENMKEFFRNIKRKNYIFCWEPRGDWEEGLIRKICEELNLVHCVDPFKNKALFGEIRYFRLHGKTGYNYRYSDEELNYLKEKIEKGIPTYVMFNNVYMFEDALRFKKIMKIK